MARGPIWLPAKLGLVAQKPESHTRVHEVPIHVNAKRQIVAAMLSLLLDPRLGADRQHNERQSVAVPMQADTQHLMISIGCQINGKGPRYSCVIDSGATHTIVSERILKAEGPLVDVVTANGVVHMHQKTISLNLAGQIELKANVFVQSGGMPGDAEVLLGEDILRQFHSVVFNYEKRQVEFYR